MQCQTVLPGAECTFWSKQGCIFEGNSCQLVVEACQGCERIVDGSIGPVCSVAPAPAQKWKQGLCNFATHQKVEIKNVETKINPLKASKKAAAGKKK
ncbi:MAG: PxxKW family cysteine-rich protein [Desulfuromonadaceae bacterium]